MVSFRPAVLLLFLVGMVLLSCARPEHSGALTPLRMNVAPALKYGPFMIAKDEGFFEQEGIDAVFVSIDQNSALLAATNGGLDVYSGPVRSGLFNAMLRGVPLQVVADKGHSTELPCAPEAFAAPAAMADRIAADGGSLRGERVALIAGGVTEYLIDKLLEQRQVTRADVELSQMPQGDYLSRSNRRMDAVRYMSEPQLSKAVADGSMKIVASAQDVAPGHQQAVVTFGRRLLLEDPELGRRFMRAYLRGVRQYNMGKTNANVIILSRHTRLPQELIRASCWMPMAADGQVRQEAIQPILDWFLARGYLEAPIPRSVWWNARFIDP